MRISASRYSIFSNLDLTPKSLRPPKPPKPEAICGEREDVSSVHTLLSGIVQVCHELLVGEEEKKEEEQGRQEETEVEREGQSEETAHMDDYVVGCENARLKLVPNVSMDEMCKRR